MTSNENHTQSRDVSLYQKLFVIFKALIYPPFHLSTIVTVSKTKVGIIVFNLLLNNNYNFYKIASYLKISGNTQETPEFYII